MNMSNMPGDEVMPVGGDEAENENPNMPTPRPLSQGGFVQMPDGSLVRPEEAKDYDQDKYAH